MPAPKHRMAWSGHRGLGAAVVLAVLLSACAASRDPGATAPLSPPHGRIFVYRPDSPSIVGMAEVPFVYLDDRRRGRLCKGCFLKLPVEPGRHRVTIRASFMTAIPFYKLGELEVDVGGEQDVFLRYVANVDQAHKFGPYPPVTTFLIVPPEIARRALQAAREVRP